MIMPDSPTLAVMVSLSTSQPMSKIKERKVTLNVEPFSTVNGYKYSLIDNRLLLSEGSIGRWALRVKVKTLHNKTVVLDMLVSSILPEKFGALKFKYCVCNLR